MISLIESELALCPQITRDAVKPLLIELQLKMLTWEYAGNRLTYEQLPKFPAWVFAELGERNIFAVYCLGGFGALGNPWGLTFGDDEYFGMDSGWFPKLHGSLEDWGLDEQSLIFHPR